MENKKRNLYIFACAFVLGIFALSFAIPAGAFEFKGGDVVVVASGEVIEDDLYVGAATVEINGTIKGDLVAFGSNITIGSDGVIEEDLIAAGQSVVINGEVMDDARIAGAVLTLGGQGKVGDDLVGAGYSLETNSATQIGGDLLFTGAQAMLEGNIQGNIKVSSGGVEINGQIAGDAEIEVGAPGDVAPFSPFQFIPNMPAVPVIAGGLTIGPDTVIEGDMVYKSPEEADVPSWAVSGEVDFEEIEAVEVDEGREPEPTTGELVWKWFLRNLRRLISLLIVGLLVAWLLPDFIEQATAQLQAKPWPSLGWGVLFYFGFYFLVMVILVLTTILTVLFGVLTLAGVAWLIFGVGIVTIINLILAFVIATAFLTKIIISYLVGRLILERLKPEWALSIFWSFILGVIIFVVLTAIPYVGWIVNLAVIFFGLGALLLLVKDRFIKPEVSEVKKPTK